MADPGGHCWTEWLVRYEVRRIIESYTLTMVGSDTAPYIEACADDVIAATLGWPVAYRDAEAGESRG